MKDNPSSLEKSTDFSDANNVSFSSNESADCDTDSCTSSVVSIFSYHFFRNIYHKYFIINPTLLEFSILKNCSHYK